MLIHYVRGGNAYLPELAAYADFLQGLGHQAQIHQDSASVPGDAAVVWWLCGRVPRHAARRFAHAFQVHEYASASVPPWAWLKDRAKRASQPQPQYRLFQNAWVRARLGFAALLKDAPPVPVLEQAIAANEGDLRARHLLAVHHLVGGDPAAGLEQLIEMLRRDRDYEDGLPKKALIDAFRIVEDEDLVGQYRRRMASLLF